MEIVDEAEVLHARILDEGDRDPLQTSHQTRTVTPINNTTIVINNSGSRTVGFSNTSIPTNHQGDSAQGRLSHFLNQWKKITAHKWPLSIVEEGYRLQWVSPPVPWQPPRIVRNQTEQTVVDQAVNRFIPILSSVKTNSYIMCQHFKMEGIPALRDLLEPMDKMAKCNLKMAYMVVKLHKESR
ncbi:hypothetical protein BDB00DRAFT_903867 [Zychaea mexicana]|uniref:uncharacterized protein n=1 Tax=Zychaea mexicana TaxID=64656 RepID=UPI0022FDC149|nr:uncharacterized protein BDB00DRAFT_903867 [Zychaea mexicana]KAI9494291.1 hypothetical protein BDB00DRAFT_903867 [Zychaea mexicana]